VLSVLEKMDCLSARKWKGLTVLQSAGYFFLEILVSGKVPTTSLAQRQYSMCVCGCKKQAIVDSNNITILVFFILKRVFHFRDTQRSLHVCLSRTLKFAHRFNCYSLLTKTSVLYPFYLSSISSS